jgi:hypothetical protein
VYSQKYEHAHFDGYTSFDCDVVQFDSSALTLGFALKPSKAYTGSVLSLNRVDGSPFIQVAIEIGGWVKAVMVFSSKKKKEAQVKEPGLTGERNAGKKWIECNLLLDLAGGHLKLRCGDQGEQVAIEETSLASTPSELKLSLGCDDAHKTSPSSLGTKKGYRGVMDDIRLWSVVRRNSQLKVNADAELSGDEAGLEAYYRMGEEIHANLTVLDGTAGGKHCFLNRPRGVLAENEHFIELPSSKRRIQAPDPSPVLTSSGRRRRKLLEAAPRNREVERERERRLESSLSSIQSSCLGYKEANDAVEDGVVIISINGTLTKVFCDFNRAGGGWTLLMSNAGGGGFTSGNLLKRYPTAPSKTSDYSMLGHADEILANGPSGHSWSYMVEVDLASGETVGGIYSAPSNASLLTPAGSVATRQTVTLQQKIGIWEPTPLGLQHLLPEIHHPMVTSIGREALLTTSARPAINPWGALVNTGDPSSCHASTAFFKQCSVRARLWIREAPQTDEVPCDVEQCAISGGAAQQCKIAECSGSGQCVYRLDKPDATECDDLDP